MPQVTEILEERISIVGAMTWIESMPSSTTVVGSRFTEGFGTGIDALWSLEHSA